MLKTHTADTAPETNQGKPSVKMIVAAAALGFAALLSAPSANAVVCARGAYHAGCAGPNGAAVARRPYGYNQGYYHHGYYGHPPVTCARGPYRAGCAGPNGAVVRRTY